ncbi:TIGR03761 family integrating conjugative element protein [bacterium]|nr:TIGR03761 family integrating conjugative element protein [bacterium]
MTSKAPDTIINGTKPLPTLLKTVPKENLPKPIDITDLLCDYDLEEELDLSDDSEEVKVPFKLELQTEKTQKVWNGKRPEAKDEGGHRGYPGVKHFVTSVGKVCRKAQMSDPYALQSLLNIEQQMADMNEDIEQSIAKVEAVLNSNRENGIKFHDVPGRHFKPATYPIVARNQYSLTAATLVGKYDRAVRYALTARAFNLISRKEYGTVHRKAGAFVKLTLMSFIYKPSGTTVNDFLNENEKAQDAVQKYGTIDDVVLQDDFKLRLLGHD